MSISWYVALIIILCVLHGRRILWPYKSHKIMIWAIYHDIHVIFCLNIKFVAIFSRPKYSIFCLSATIWKKTFITKEPYDTKGYLERVITARIRRYQNFWSLSKLLSGPVEISTQDEKWPKMGWNTEISVEISKASEISRCLKNRIFGNLGSRRCILHFDSSPYLNCCHFSSNLDFSILKFWSFFFAKMEI